MSIKDKISVHPTRKNFQDGFGVNVYVDREEREIDYPPISFSEVKEHLVNIGIGVIFRCNEAELRDAEARARSQLIYELYKEQRTYAFDALNAVQSGSKPDALEALDRLIQSMQP